MNMKDTLRMTVRLVGLIAGVIVASGGAYLTLSGVVLACDQKFLPGILDMLIAFLMFQAGRRIIPFCKLSRDA